MFLNKGNYQSTIRRASYDDANGESLVENDDIEVYLLDEAAKNIAAECEMDIPSSCDALRIKGRNNFVIEFRNREYKTLKSSEKRDIRKKAYQTAEILQNIFFRACTME